MGLGAPTDPAWVGCLYVGMGTDGVNPIHVGGNGGGGGKRSLEEYQGSEQAESVKQNNGSLQ